MLVFQDNRQHIKERCEDAERCGKPFSWLVDIVADINRYLPGDWRLTRSTNNFRIQIVTPGVTCALAGFSYRHGDQDIMHICNTLFGRHFFDPNDVRNITEDRSRKINQDFIKKHPEISIPNLYYFRPCPSGFQSPLFARQYEKVTKDPGNPIQYHRIHPLFKHGLDQEHPLWVRWDTGGNVEIAMPRQGYHGKDYWKIKNLNKEKGQGAAARYLGLYGSILSENGVAPRPERLQKQDVYHAEYKFLFSGKSAKNQTAQLLMMLKEFTGNNGFGLETVPDNMKYTDTYLDDTSRCLYHAGISLRIRDMAGMSYLCIKKRSSHESELRYRRFKEEIIITPEQKETIFSGNPTLLLPFRLLEAAIDDHGPLVPALTVTVNRNRFHVERQGTPGIAARLSVDEVKYSAGAKKWGPLHEIELEAVSATSREIGPLVSWLEEEAGLVPSRQTKYQRGTALTKTSATGIKTAGKKVIIDTDCGVDDALALILALKAPELDVRAVTTVSGNVHIDKVIPNIFKVFKALELKEPPPVAMGTGRPLEREFVNADSVHGSDGLGDKIPEPPPDDVDIHDLPAWELICKLAREKPGEITMITVGPMTNLALAIQEDPEGVRCLKEVVSMGGVFFDVGNVGPDAEFNVASDPEAAAVCVEFCKESMRQKDVSKKVPLTFVGLDVTHKVCLRRAVMQHLVKGNPANSILQFVRDITGKYMDFYRANEGLPGCYLHDPLAVAHVINPAFLDIEKHIIRVETRGQFTSGVIFPDDRPTRNREWRDPSEAVIGIARRVEKEAFEEFFLQRLAE